MAGRPGRELDWRLKRLARGELDRVELREGRLYIRPIRTAPLPEVKALGDRLDAMLPRVRVTELLHEVALGTGFLGAFTNFRKGLADTFRLTPVALGFLFSSFLWAYSVLVVPMGLLVDRFGAKRVAGLGLAVWSAATAAGGVVPGYGSLLLTRLAMGGAEAVSNPSGARVVRAWFPAGERGLVTALFNAGSYAGPALCALVAGPLIAAFGWRSLFFMSGGLGLVWLLFWLGVFDAPAAKASSLLHLLRVGPGLWGVAVTQGCNVYAQYLSSPGCRAICARRCTFPSPTWACGPPRPMRSPPWPAWPRATPATGCCAGACRATAAGSPSRRPPAWSPRWRRSPSRTARAWRSCSPRCRSRPSPRPLR